MLDSSPNRLRKGNQGGLVKVLNFEILEETERERGINKVVNNEILPRGGNGEGRDRGLVGINWHESSFLR